MTTANNLVQGLLLGGLYALFATGLSLMFGVMRLVNLAHGDFAILAAFLALVVVDGTGLHPLLTLAIVVPAMFAVGYLLQRGVLNFTVGGDGLAPVLVTFGLSIILQNVLLELFSADSRGLDAGAVEDTSLALGRLNVGWFPLLTLLTGAAVLAGLQLLLARTRLGRALRATAEPSPWPPGWRWPPWPSPGSSSASGPPSRPPWGRPG
jgi:branched-chain amino acid transport system permease protein